MAQHFVCLTFDLDTPRRMSGPSADSPRSRRFTIPEACGWGRRAPGSSASCSPTIYSPTTSDDLCLPKTISGVG